MAFVAAATSVGAAVLGTGAAAGIGSTIVGGALIGAGVGGLYSAVTGDGDILNSMLTGGLIGGVGAGLGSAMGIGAKTAAGGASGLTPAAAASAPSTIAAPTANVATVTPAMQAAAQQAAANAANLEALAVLEGGPQVGMLGAANTGLPANTVLPASMTFTPPAQAAATGLTGKEMLGYGLAGSAALSLLGNMGQKKIPAASQSPSYIRPYTYSSSINQPTGVYPNPYVTTKYDEMGNPVLDTRERDYFTQTYTAQEPYKAAQGGLMDGGPVERMSTMDRGRGMYPMGMIEQTNFAKPTQRPASMEVVQSDYDMPVNPMTGLPPIRMADGGDPDEEMQKLVSKNLKKASTKELQEIIKAMDEQEFLRRNMPQYAESMRPSIMGMVEEAQYGDRMAQSFGATDFNVIPTVVDPQNRTYGGIASIGQQIDPNTRVNMMADIQRTPFDRSSLDAVRRVGAGIDRKIGKDANLSAFYEQDPMGRSKMGGARFTQRFAEGGSLDEYIKNEIINKAQGSAPSYTYDPAKQQYSQGAPAVDPANIPAAFNPLVVQAYQAQNPNKYSYDASKQRYSAGLPTQDQYNAYLADIERQREMSMADQLGFSGYASGGQAGGQYNLGSYSDGGRLLKGPGDGMSDNIPATIGKRQPARLADGEFVVPADVVSHLGNGSTDAGAKRLYAMMDKVRKARTGNKKQGKEIKAEKFIPV